VGGAVRDFLLGRPPQDDFDLVTRGDAIALAELLWNRRIAQHPPVTYPRFGTAMVHIDGIAIELITARKESYEPDSRKPHVEPATYLQDALRRDFTVNALLRSIHSGEITDPLGIGRDDLAAGILRTPTDATERFCDDPLRMLRAVRFKWKLGFRYAEGLEDAIRAERHRLAIVSRERIRDELQKMIVGPDADRAYAELMDLGLLHEFAPEFESMVGVEQGSYHHLDVWEHSLLVLRNLPPGSGHALAWAALLHDVAKPATKFIDEEGNTRFFGHESQGAEMARQILRRLKFAERDVDSVARLVQNHMRLGSSKNFTPAAARRLIRDLGNDVLPLLELVEADTKSLRPGLKVMDLEPIRERVALALKATPASTLRSPLSGQQVMEVLEIGPGPQVGEAMRYLENLVIEGELAADDIDGAKERLRKWR